MRKLIFVKTARSESWSCSECGWAFNPSGPPRGHSLEDMMQDFERQREKEFAAHVCMQHPKPTAQKL
jgi:rubredoxin